MRHILHSEETYFVEWEGVTFKRKVVPMVEKKELLKSNIQFDMNLVVNERRKTTQFSLSVFLQVL